MNTITQNPRKHTSFMKISMFNDLYLITILLISVKLKNYKI